MNTQIFLALLLVLSAIDAALTIAIIKRGGRELNPVLAKLMGKVGVEWALLIVKLAGVGVVWALGPIPTGAQYVLLAAYALVCLWNAKELRK